MKDISGKLLILAVVAAAGFSILWLSTYFIDPAVIADFLVNRIRGLGVEGDTAILRRLTLWTFFFVIKLGLSIGVAVTLLILASWKTLGRSRTDALVINGMVFGASLVFVLSMSEIAVRLIFREITTTSDNTSYFARRWYKQKGNVRLNTLGFREREFETRKSNHVYRIAVIGDSFAFGQGIEESKRFSNLVEESLNKGARGDRYEVLNFGRPGTATVDHLAVLEEVVMKVDPDFVLLQWYVNDFEYNYRGRPSRSPLIPAKELHFILHRSSALYYLLNRQWRSVSKSLTHSGSYADYMFRRFGNPESTDSRKTMTALRKFIRLCKARQISTGIVLFPDLANLGNDYPYGYLHNRVVQVCLEEGVKYLDLRPVFARSVEKASALWVNRFDSHPGVLANRLAAEHLLDTFGQVWRANDDDK